MHVFYVASSTSTSTTTTSTLATSSLPCPAKDTRCAASDGSNVMKTVTTEDDAECGG